MLRLVRGYCFARNANIQGCITILVARLYQRMAGCTARRDVKSKDDYATPKLATVLRRSRVKRSVCMCDQDGDIETMVQAALHIRGAQGSWTGAVPEHSAFGGSQSNGKAVGSFRELEDMLRTHNAILEARVGAWNPSTHPVVRWLIGCTATILNKCKIQAEHRHDIAAHGDIHGHEASEKLAGFGERVLARIPVKQRAKLDLSLAASTCLGTTVHSNEALIGLESGEVVRS